MDAGLPAITEVGPRSSGTWANDMAENKIATATPPVRLLNLLVSGLAQAVLIDDDMKVLDLPCH